MKKGENIRLRADGRYEARYIKDRDASGRIIYGYAYGKTLEEAREKRQWQIAILKHNVKPRLMNLLLLGAGSHGQEVYEIACNLRIFNKIVFLDDTRVGKEIIGKCDDYLSLHEEYPLAVPTVGNQDFRRRWTQKLSAEGFIIPTLIDPSAFVSRNVSIGYGTVICARAVINTGSKIGNGCIVSSGSVIAREAQMSDWSFIDSGETLLENGEIK